MYFLLKGMTIFQEELWAIRLFVWIFYIFSITEKSYDKR